METQSDLSYSSVSQSPLQDYFSNFQGDDQAPNAYVAVPFGEHLIVYFRAFLEYTTAKSSRKKEILSASFGHVNFP